MSEVYGTFEEFWENANRRLTDFNEKQARMIWQAATEQGAPQGYTPVKTEVLHWLLGEAKEFEPPEWQRKQHEKVYGKLGPFWWRTHLRSAALGLAHHVTSTGVTKL